MFQGQKVPDLIGGIETDRFEYSYGKDRRILQLRYPGHQLCNALRHGIGSLRIMRDLRGHEDPCSKAGFVECRGAFEDKVVQSEVLHEDDVAWADLLRTHQALPYPQEPEPVRHRHYASDKNE